MDVESVVQSSAPSNDAGYSATKPALYITIILSVVLAAGAYKLRTEGILACPASGYNSDRYLAYCQAVHYGDYEHGAFWFDLEPSVLRAAKEAKVLFVGDSRTQFAFSTSETARWSDSNAASYYLLGFTYWGNTAFLAGLLSKLKPQAKVYIVSVDPFIENRESPPANTVMHDSAANAQYEVKQLWQIVHKRICTALPGVCGSAYVIFRSRKTGAYYRPEGKLTGQPVSYDQNIDRATVEVSAALARDFLSHLPVRTECIILTTVPTVKTNFGIASAVATSLGTRLVAPRLDGLGTFDASHLENSSAERWSAAFLEEIEPQVRKCLAMPEG